MKGKTIVVVLVVALVSGLIGAFGVNELSGEAGAAPQCPPKCPTPTQSPAPVPSPSPQTGRLIELGTIFGPANGTAQFPLVDVRDCSAVSAFASRAGGGGLEVTGALVSIDGVTTMEAEAHSRYGSISGATASLGSWPFVGFGVRHSGDDTNITGWLWCAP